MPKVTTTAFADQAADAFNRTVDALVMQKLTNLPSLAESGVSSASPEAANTLPVDNGRGGHSR